MLIIRKITHFVVNLFKKPGEELKVKGGREVRDTMNNSEADPASLKRELQKLNQIIAYQRALIKGTKENGFLQVISLQDPELEFAWLRIEYLTRRSVVFSVYHPTVSTGRFRNERLGKAAIEFTGDTAFILNIYVHPDFLRTGIAENLLSHIERESAQRGKLFVKYIVHSEQYSAIKSLDALFKKAGFDPGSLGYDRSTYVKIIKYD